MAQDCPPIPDDLIEYLDLAFPERCPDPKWDDRRIWREVGKREIIRFLKRKHTEQNENVLQRNTPDVR